MRIPEPDTRPVVLTVAGSDSGGGAGVQADLTIAEACSAFVTSAITAVTAQHTRGVESTHVLPPKEISAQIETGRDDFAVDALKAGMLATKSVIELVADHAADLAAPIVVDPAMVATSGDRLLDPEAEGAYGDLLAHATLATPNAEEAELLTGVAVEDQESAVEAGRVLRETGVDAVLVTGGHVAGDTVQDVLVTADSVETFEYPRVDTDATHGSGCTLASAVAARLAHGDPLVEAVQAGTDLLGAREFDPALRFAVNRRFDTAIEQRLDDLAGVVVEIDRHEEPEQDEERSTMGWAARRAFEQADGAPVAVYDRGAVGNGPVVRVPAPDAETVTRHALTLAGCV